MRIFVFVFLLFLVFPFFSFADHGGFHTPLVTCDICTICDIFKLVQNVLNFIWWDIAIPLAALFIAYGGLLMIVPYFGQSPAMHEKGKKVLTNALFGILIVFFAWLGIDTIIKILGQQELASGAPATINQLGPWNQIVCTAPPIAIAPQPNGDGGCVTGGQCGNPGDVCQESCTTAEGCPGQQTRTCGADKTYGDPSACVRDSSKPCTPDGGEEGDTFTHNEAAQILTDNQIGIVSTGDCFDQQNPKCTSFEGIPQKAITELTNRLNPELKNNCIQEGISLSECSLVVTSGTETGHKTHGPGKSIMDLKANRATNSLIQKKIGTSNPTMNTWYNAGGNEYYFWEGSHWHVCFQAKSCPHVHETEAGKG